MSRQHTTTLIVASRPSTISLADEIVVVDDGKVVAHGPHAELLETVPVFRHLVEAYEHDRHSRSDDVAVVS